MIEPTPRPLFGAFWTRGVRVRLPMRVRFGFMLPALALSTRKR